MRSVPVLVLASLLGLAGCTVRGPRPAAQVKFVGECQQQQVVLVAEAMLAWNRACGREVLTPAPDDEPLGDVRVLCGDTATFGKAEDGYDILAWYSPSERKLVVPRISTEAQLERMPGTAAHELGHFLLGSRHRDEDPISVMRTFYTPRVATPSEGDVAALREQGFDCWANGTANVIGLSRNKGE